MEFWNDLQSLTECVRMEPRAHKNTRTEEEEKKLRGWQDFNRLYKEYLEYESVLKGF